MYNLTIILAKSSPRLLSVPLHRGDTHHRDIENVTLDSKTETAGVDALIGTHEDAGSHYGGCVPEGMRSELLEVFHDTLVVH
jgi:hypothetical protein